jgi:hypothetical protein
MFWDPRIGDAKSKQLARRLEVSAAKVSEPQRSRILSRLPGTVFISHTSRDKELIGGPADPLVFGTVSDFFYDPFLHNIGMGAASEYEKVVGLALQASKRVVVVWSARARQSDYVRAEMFLASRMGKDMLAYIAPGAPRFPLRQADVARNIDELRAGLLRWKASI